MQAKDTESMSGRQSSVFNTQAGRTKSNSIEVPSIVLPKGGGAIKSIDEKFSVNAANGTAAFSIPLPVSPTRGAAPELKLSYNSGSGNGIFGLGWNVDLPSIKRKTTLELPRYGDAQDTDTFLYSGSEDLTPEFQKEADGSFSQGPDGDYITREQDSADGAYIIRFYRPRIEDAFARIERWTHKTSGEVKWRVTTKENTTTLFGWSQDARIADPADELRVYEWLPEFVFDDKGNCSRYTYKAEDATGFNPSHLHNKNRRQDGNLIYTNRYLEKVLYGNKTPYAQFGDPFPAETDFVFHTVLDYGEYDMAPPYQKVGDWSFRQDAFSECKPGFEVRTTRLCRRVLLLHFFAGLPGGSALVKSLDFTYDTSAEKGFTFLKAITQRGYIKRGDGAYTQKALPALEFDYQKHAWNSEVKNVETEDIVHAPTGLKEPEYQFTDLYGEGLPGILTEQAEGWYYKRNLGGGTFARATQVSPKPSFTGLGKKLRLIDLDADGSKQLVSLNEQPRGYFELEDKRWRSFKTLPNIDFNDRNTRMLDLTGDGKTDVVITEDHVLTWYESEGRKGYSAARRQPKPFDEEAGPAIVFADAQQTIFLADMSGDGLIDIVRIRNGEVCYWPNLGYGTFGAKVGMDNAPVFAPPDTFNPAYLELADIDGSGTTDILYISNNQCQCWLNLSGNAFATTPFVATPFPDVHDMADVTVVDLLGDGLSCIVWSSSLTKDAHAPLRYIDLMGGKKPHLMTAYRNNLGKEVMLAYTPSTAFYLEDERAGRPWVTKLHFPVHCITRTESIDHITDRRFVSTYRYHHGYYDRPEQEFRGFGMVEQADAEHFEHWVKSGASNVAGKELHQAPVVTKTWFHTGAFLGKDNILTQFADDYWYAEMTRQGFSAVHSEYEMEDAKIIAAPGISPATLAHMNSVEWQQALRACKGTPLRKETFAHDAPLIAPTPAQVQQQLTPYSVDTRACTIELLQPKGHNKHAIFTVKEREVVEYAYERDTSDPRIMHDLNLVVDEYGNVLESAKVVYPRKTADTTLPAATQAAQAKAIITYHLQQFTNDVITANAYRLRAPSEEKSFELRGIAKAGAYFAHSDFQNILTTAADVPYHQMHNTPPPGLPEKRLVEHIRTTYYKNDLTGALPLHTLESRGLQFEQYQLAYTPQLLTDVFGTKVTPAVLGEGKFVHSEGDANWWVRSGRTLFTAAGESQTDAATRFYMPIAYSDPHGAVTKVSYLNSTFMFIAETEDALGNKTTVESFNFRTLLPRRMRDANDNISEVLADELGFIKAAAVFGKGDEADDLSGLDESTSNAERADIAAFFAATTSAELVTRGKALLRHASAVTVYDLDAFSAAGKPAVTASIIREEYFKLNSNSPIQISFEYSNGFGQVVMKKSQAEPGLAKRVTVAPDNTYTVEEVDTNLEVPKQLRWVGDGRVVMNNKGKPIKQYEPYFSVTHQYEDTKELVESGVTSILYYDAIGREVKTELPNGTYTQMEYGSWKQVTYDPADTVLGSAWYHNRANSLIDAELLAQGKDPAKEKLAALASAKHANTPKVEHFDALKRPILQVEHNKTPTDTDEFYHTSAVLDVEGNLLQITDARGNVVMRHKYDMLGNLVYQLGMDNGQRWMLLDIADQPLRTWDERNHEFRYTYDILQRPLQTRIVGGDGPSPLDNIYERVFYGESEPNATLKNLRGQPVRQYDTGGLLAMPEYDFKGQAPSSIRRLFKDYKGVANWTDANIASDLEPESFTATTTYDALGRVRQQAMPDGSKIITAYNEAGLVGTKTLIAASGTSTPVITDIDYNEKGQRTKLVHGNGVMSVLTYDRETFRLQRIASKKQNNDRLQDLVYTYDAMGNVTHIEDRDVPTAFFNNQMITGTSAYAYDALYRIVRATGRENNAALAIAAQDNWDDASFMQQMAVGDPMAQRNYTQTYQYDAVGNILKMQHQATGNNWMRDYTYHAANNRLLSTQVGGNTYNYTHHPQHGFMTAMPHLQEMGWSFKEELVKTIRQKTATGTPETTYYQYDSQGQRLRKITENAAAEGATPAKKDERIYLGGYELYSRHSGQHAGLKRHSTLVKDNDRCFAMLETRNDINDNTEQQLLRYQLHNHLGSVNIELDQAAQVITYEEYSPYGTTMYQARNSAIRAAAKRYRFTGMERDEESGLSYHSARYYAPWLARWLSPDPLGLEEGVNFYEYALANPYLYTDTNGMDPSTPDPTQFADFGSFWNAFGYPASEKHARELWEQQQDDIVTEQEEEYDEQVTEYVEEKYTEEEEGGARYAAGLAFAGMGADVMTPEPTDVAVPKWIVYGGVAIIAGITLAVTSSTTVTKTRTVPRVTTRRRRRKAPLTYITYTLSNPVTGQIYVGRSSGYGTPQQILNARYSGHHMRAFGFGNPQLDRAIPATQTFARRHSDPSYRAIRGREQLVIDAFRPLTTLAGLSRSGNGINGIGLTNVRRASYMLAGLIFGPVSTKEIFKKHPVAAAVP